MTNVMPVVLYLEYYDKTEFSNLAAFFSLMPQQFLE